MEQKKPIQRLLIILLVFLSFHQRGLAQDWNPHHAVGTIDAVYNFSYTQTPSQLVEVYPAANPNTGLAYQWEQSSTPLSGFTAITTGGTLSSYTFSGPLTQTTYFRRKTMDPSHSWAFIYSNTVKISVVSQNWEDLNYVREHVVTTTGLTTWQAVDQLAIGSKFQTTNYLDGLGRSVEQVSRETATPSSGTLWGDAVQFSQYDVYGRKQVAYLPYTTTSESGKFKTTAQTEQALYYTTNYNESNAYNAPTFDNSPLNRIQNVKEAGTTWSASAGKTLSYDVNSSADDVKIFTVSYTQGSAPALAGYPTYGVYADNTLYKITYTDENGKKVVEYKDQSGNLVLKKVQLSDTPSSSYSGWICTYYVYDEFGLLRYQLQPEAVNYLSSHSWSFSGTAGTQVLNEYCFQYDYDDKGRAIWKKVPGAEPLNMLYDNRDRVVYMQDGNQAALSTPQWTASIYDDLDRPIASTLYNTTKTIATLKSDIAGASLSASITVTNTANNGGTSVTINTSFCPLTSTELNTTATTTVLKYIFYDNYSFPNVKSFNTGFTNLSAYSTSDPDVQDLSVTSRSLGMPTGSETRVLGSNNFLSSTGYYDDRGSLIQMLEDNIKSGVDITTTQYHFDGRVLSTCNDHTTSGTGYTNFQILTKPLFDKIGRVVEIDKQIGSNSMKSIATYEYDDMGRLKKKRLDPDYTDKGNEELEALNYSYNIHNQLTGINKDYALKNPVGYDKWGHFFGQYIGYDNSDGVFANGRLNGQATGVLWCTQGDDAQRKYDYEYDNAGRLTNASFTEQAHLGDGWSASQMDFSVSGYTGKITYDLNGNLLSMLQKGVIPGATAPITIDDLRYAYATNSNKLLSVTDQMTSTSVNGLFGDLKDGSNGTNPDYVYDANGNVVVDFNKSVKELNSVTNGPGIHYNFLDKPDHIRLAGKGVIDIVYSGDGRKLKRTYTPDSGPVSVTTYINQFVYQATGTNPDELAFINIEEGRIRVMESTYQYNGYDFLIVDGTMNMPNSKRGIIDYYIFDYQQNMRMMLTEETHVAANMATMETSRATTEEALFGQAGSGNEVAASRYPTASTGWTGNTSTYVSRLGNLAGQTLGPNSLQKVMAGDQVYVTTNYYHNTSPGGTDPNLGSSILNSILQSLTNGPAADLVKNNASTITSQLSLNSDLVNYMQSTTNTFGGPAAYVTLLFFDERFNFIGTQNGGAIRAQTYGSVTSDGDAISLGYLAPKNGYVYAYASNQSDGDVYFDNFSLMVAQGNLAEENHYYSFGMKITALSSKKYSDSYDGHPENRYGMQGAFAEMDDDIGWNDFALRNYDPQIGRWAQIDPYADNYTISPYTGMGNDPGNTIDPSGGNILSGLSLGEKLVVGAVAGGIIGEAAGVASGDDSFKGAAIGAVIGAALGASNVLTVTKAVIQVANTAEATVNGTLVTQAAGAAQSGTTGHGPSGGNDPGGNGGAWVRNLSNYQYEWVETATPNNVAAGYKYVGTNDDDILRDLGLAYKFGEVETRQVGFTEPDMEDQGSAYHLETLVTTSSLDMWAKVSVVQEGSKFNKKFEGVVISIVTKLETDEDIRIAADAKFTYLQGYGKFISPPQTQTQALANHDTGGPSIRQAGTYAVTATFFIPAYRAASTYPKQLRVHGSFFLFSTVNPTPIVYHGLVPIPVTFTHNFIFKR